jgi:hypothetical protein
MIQHWDSPYQTEAHYNGLKDAGILVDKLILPDSQIYFDGNESAPLTAWEVGPNVDIRADILGGRRVFQLADTTNGLTNEDSYYTLALHRDADRFSSRFMRNVRKAQNTYPEHRLVIVETPLRIKTAIEAFNEHPNRRDDLETTEFSRRVSSLMGHGAMAVYALQSDEQLPIGVACVLKSSKQANLRYYSADRQGCAGHLLHYLLIEELFSKQSLDIVDLSGITPVTTDSKLSGIDEFKRQIGGETLEFRQVG